MNRCKHRTQLILNYPARLILHGATYPNCRIVNASADGVFLACFQTEGGVEIPLRLDAVTLSKTAIIEIPINNSGDSHISSPARICHISESGIGIKFLRPREDILRHLAKHQSQVGRDAGSEAAASGRSLQKNHGMLASALQEISASASGFLDVVFSRFLDRAIEWLFEVGDKSSSNEEYRGLSHAINVLEGNHTTIRASYLAILEGGIRSLDPASRKQLAASQASEQDDQLSLVDQSEFDDWVSVVGIARLIDAEHSERLHHVEKCLAYLSNTPINNESNPLSPYFLLWSLKRTLDPYEVSCLSKKLIYKAFRQEVLSEIESLYMDLDAVLSYPDSAVVPDSAAVPVSTAAPEASAAARKPEMRREPKKRTLTETLSSMFGFGTTDPSHAGRSADQGAEVEGTVSPDDMIHALERISIGKGQSLCGSIESELRREGYPSPIDSVTRGAIDGTHELLSSLKDDVRFGSLAQDLVGGIEKGLIKEAINDPGMFDKPDHPVRKLLDTVDELVPYLSSYESQSSGASSALFGQIRDLLPLGAQMPLAEMTPRIEEILERQKKRYNENLSIVVEHARVDEAHSTAEQSVLDLLSDKLAGRSVSILVQRLLDLGWARLLVITAAAGDSSSRKSRAYRDVLDFFLKVFQPSGQMVSLPERTVSEVSRRLIRGFTEYPVHQANAAQLVADVEQILRGNAEIHRKLVRQAVVLDRPYLEKLILEDRPDRRSPASAKSEWRELVIGISVDDWIVEQSGVGHVRMLNLAWKNDTSARYIFVDGDGKKALEVDVDPLAMQFEQGKYSRLKDKGMPVIERAVHRAMESSFAALKAEVDRDSLTGLLSRKAFEREAARLLETAKAEGAYHVLIELDIDQFSLINDNYGIEGGDKLLQNVANILTTYLSREAKLARIGDDEFGILIENCTLDRGYEAAEIHRNALRNYRFPWNSSNVGVTASVGVVSIDNLSGTLAKVLRSASSACALAKQGGRNRTLIYQPTEKDFEQREQLIRSVPIIEQAIENDRLLLFRQIIEPIFVGQGDQIHYEILLRVLDDNGKPGGPVQFIQAAEQYGRMRSVDRWVVNTLFRWLEESGHKVDFGAGFSVNLSGQSVVDPSFQKFLIEILNGNDKARSAVSFEITETSLVKQIDKTLPFLETLKKLGCQLLLDDFGSGYASYSYLKDLPIDIIKIDGIFVKDMLEDKPSHAMVKSITEISHHLGKKVIAEYVENEAILIGLRKLDVDFAQGFGIGRPISLSEWKDG